MRKKVGFRYLITYLAVIYFSLLQTYAIKVFVGPANLLSSRFTRVAILMDRIASLYGAYSKEQMSLLHTVVSAYEVQDVAELIKEIDQKAIINVLTTENFFGGPID